MGIPEIVVAIVAPVMMIGVFALLSISAWSNARRKEREALYRAELMKKVAESAGAGGTTVLEMLREDERASRKRRREGQKFGGLVAVATGLGIMAFLSVIERHEPAFMVGLIPLFVGLAMLVYAYLIGERD